MYKGRPHIYDSRRTALAGIGIRHDYIKYSRMPMDMETVYVLIQCDLGKETEIIDELGGISEVIEVRGTYGIYDIFCKIQAGSKGGLDGTVRKIRKIPRIHSTVTLHQIPSQGGR